MECGPSVSNNNGCDDKLEQVLTLEVLDKVERHGLHGISYGERTPVVLALP